jgi:hypothetical protein
MPHFALLDENNAVVMVLVGRQEDDGKEQELSDRTGSVYKQTSYNTFGGEHPEGRPFRKNYAGIGYTYDAGRDAFIPPKPFASWVLNEQTCQWNAPVPYPIGDSIYTWNELNQSWDQVN